MDIWKRHSLRTAEILRDREFHFNLMEISFFVGKERVVQKGRPPSQWLRSSTCTGLCKVPLSISRLCMTMPSKLVAMW